MDKNKNMFKYLGWDWDDDDPSQTHHVTIPIQYLHISPKHVLKHNKDKGLAAPRLVNLSPNQTSNFTLIEPT